MKPVVYGPDTPHQIDAFAVDWPHAVFSHTPIAIDSEPYLASIARYTNVSPKNLGVLAQRFALSESAELDRALAHAHVSPAIAAGLAARLLARSSLRVALAKPDEARVLAADFAWIDPFLVEGTLASALYHYGMYRYFRDENDASVATAQTRALLAQLLPSPLERVVVLQTRLAWSDFFDVHSVTDRSLLVIDRGVRRGALLAFSHSD